MVDDGASLHGFSFFLCFLHDHCHHHTQHLGTQSLFVVRLSHPQVPPTQADLPTPSGPRPEVMEESKPPRRMKGVTVCLPIVYGSIAWHVTKKGDSQDQCTHQWTCTFGSLRRGYLAPWFVPHPLFAFLQTVYVRSPHGHDLGTVLKKAIFTLHPSFLNHIRGTCVLCLVCLPSSPFAASCGDGVCKEARIYCACLVLFLQIALFLYMAGHFIISSSTAQDIGGNVLSLRSIPTTFLTHVCLTLPRPKKTQRWPPTHSR